MGITRLGPHHWGGISHLDVVVISSVGPAYVPACGPPASYLRSLRRSFLGSILSSSWPSNPQIQRRLGFFDRHQEAARAWERQFALDFGTLPAGLNAAGGVSGHPGGGHCQRADGWDTMAGVATAMGSGMGGDAVKRVIGMSLGAAVALLAAHPALAQPSQNWAWCENEDNAFPPDVSVNGCSALIQSGTDPRRTSPSSTTTAVSPIAPRRSRSRHRRLYRGDKLDPNYEVAYQIAAAPISPSATSTAPSPTTTRR